MIHPMYYIFTNPPNAFQYRCFMLAELQRACKELKSKASKYIGSWKMRLLPTWSKQLTMHMLKNLETSIRDTRNVCVDIRDCYMLAIHSATLRIQLCSPSAKTCMQIKLYSVIHGSVRALSLFYNAASSPKKLIY